MLLAVLVMRCCVFVTFASALYFIWEKIWWSETVWGIFQLVWYHAKNFPWWSLLGNFLVCPKDAQSFLCTSRFYLMCVDLYWIEQWTENEMKTMKEKYRVKWAVTFRSKQNNFPHPDYLLSYRVSWEFSVKFFLYFSVIKVYLKYPPRMWCVWPLRNLITKLPFLPWNTTMRISNWM